MSENDVTGRMLAYRECARSTWNGFFRELPDGWHEFINVNEELFVGLVLVQIFGFPREDPMIRVRPRFGPKGIRVLWAREQPVQVWQWQEQQLVSPVLQLDYLAFFDWGSEGIRDFQYTRARVRSCPEDPTLEGADLLLPALECEFYVESTESL